MRIQCEVCSATYTIDDAQLTDQPIGAQCPYCGHVKLVSRAQAAPATSQPAYDPGWEPQPPDPSAPVASAPSASGSYPAPSEGAPSFGPPSVGPAASLGFAEPPPPLPEGAWGSPAGSSLDLPSGDELGPPSEGLGSGYAGLGYEADPGYPEDGSVPDASPTEYGSFGDDTNQMASAAEQIGWAQSADTSACSVCGAPLVDEFDKVIGLCELHQRERRNEESAGSASLRDEISDEWYVRPRHGGPVIGPLGLEEVRDRLRRGDMSSSDQVSRDGTRFQPVDAFPELSYINALRAHQLDGQKVSGARVARRSRVGGGLRWLVALAVLGVLGYGAWTQRDTLSRVWANVSRGRVTTLSIGLNPYQRSAEQWAEQLPETTAPIDDLLERAQERHLEDSWAGYGAAEQLYRQALAKEVDHPEALGGYIENFASWRLPQADADEIQQAEAGIRYGLRLEPGHPALHRAAAALALGRDRLNQCQSNAQDALRANPADGRARLLFAGCFLEGNVPLAIEEARSAVADEPRLRRADRVLARAYARTGRFATALEILEKRAEVDPDNAAVDLELGRIHRMLGRPERAEEHFSAALRKEGYRQEAYLELGELMLEQRRPAAVIAALEEAVRWAEPRGERAARIHTAWSRAALLQGQPGEAARRATQALEADNQYLPALVTRGEAALLLGEEDVALQMSERALKEGPNEPSALVLSGRAQARAGRSTAALKRLRKAAENDPTDPRLRGILAAFYLSQDQANQAYVVAREAAEVDPEEAKSRSRFVPTALTDGPVKEAIEAFERSSRVERNSPVAWAAIGMMYYFAGEPDQARAAVERSLRLDDANLTGLIYRAQLALDAGRPQRAERVARKLLSIERGFPLGHVLLARALADQGETEAAREEYQAALRSNPGLLAARVELAGLDARDGEVDEATREALDRAFAVNPNSLRLRRVMLRAGL
jgi:tetratricopeptide (TPR) repeat protein